MICIMIEKEKKFSPKNAIRSYCSQCLGLKQWNHKEVEDCQGDTALNGACLFYPYRLGKRPSVRAFRKYCLYCQGGSREAVSDCPTVSCPVYPYRMGRNPARSGMGGNIHQVARELEVLRQDSIFSQRTIVTP